MMNNRNQLVAQTQEISYLELLPANLLMEIMKYLPDSQSAILVMLSKTLMSKVKELDKNGHVHPIFLDINRRFDIKLARGIDLTDPALPRFFNSRAHVMRKKLNQVGLDILKGDKASALATIDQCQCPGLLLEVIESITLKKSPTHHGETHTGVTLFQLALGTLDFELYKEIGDRIEAWFGVDTKSQQINNLGKFESKNYRSIFESKLNQLNQDYDQFGRQLPNEAFNEYAKKELHAMCETIFTHPIGGNNKGVHFDPQILIDFFSLETDNTTTIDWTIKDLFWKYGLPMIQRHMPYFFAMIFAYNKDHEFTSYLTDVMEGNAEVHRSTKLGYPHDGSNFFDELLPMKGYIMNGDINIEAMTQTGRLEKLIAFFQFVQKTSTNYLNMNIRLENESAPERAKLA